MNYSEALDYLNTQGRFGIRPGLERIKLLLAKLGNPQCGISFVHVTGTNGKGSITSMLASIFQEAGLKAGKFTSPHLQVWTERININGQDIAKEDFANAISVVKEATKTIEDRDSMPTQFEILTAAAFWLFKKAKLDIVVLEVGMGGLLDSTNVIRPECSIISNVCIDHTQYFGETLEKIAKEKAGIIKEGVPVVTAAASVALNIIIDTAVPLKAPVHVFQRDFTAIGMGGNMKEQHFMFRRGDFTAKFTVSLAGDHQMVNAALAVMATKILSEKYPELTVEATKEGLKRVKWPGRLEVIAENPDVLLDGAHNVNGAEALRVALNKYYPGKDICFIVGIMKDKDIESIVKILMCETDTLIAVYADDSERAAKPEDIARFFHGKTLSCDTPKEALVLAREVVGEEGVICIAGSLYLVGYIKDLWTNLHIL